MKINTFLVAICLCSLVAKAQYIGIPDSNAIWSVWDEKYAAMGDSIYNGKAYTRFEFSNDSIFTGGTHFALIYEDSAAQKVYVIPAGDSTEHLLYDFSLSAMDTVSTAFYWSVFGGWAFPPYFENNFTVDFIDTIIVNGQSRRQWHFTGTHDRWIEGIGSTLGIFSPIGNNLVIDVPIPLLLCMQNNGVYEYGTDTINGCYMAEPTFLEENIYSVVKVFPNPATNNLKLKSSASLKSLLLYNFSGQKILEKNINDSYAIIDLSIIPSGTYLLKIEHQLGMEIKKIIISK